MSLLAALLLTLSAFLHAGWNLMGKKINPSTAFFLIASASGSIVLSPIVALNLASLDAIPTEVWLLVVLTGPFQALYMWGLAAAYRHGDISIAYPLLRTTPILFVALFTALLSQGEALTAIGLGGIIIVTSGCLLIPMQSLRHTRADAFLNRSCLFAMFSALGTIGYTLIDDKALSILRSSSLQLSVAEISVLYLFLESLSCTVCLLLIVLSTATGRQQLQTTLSQQRRPAAMAGLAMAMTYLLVLISMAYVENVSYVVAFRQLSIPVTVLFGVYLLKEHNNRFKLAGTVAIFGGVLLMSLG